MNNMLFRKSSIDRVSSPEQLNDYVKVSNPSVWMILSAVIILLVGICVWGIFGQLDTTLQTAALSQNGTVVCYVKEADIESIQVGQTVKINDTKCKVVAISETPCVVDDSFGEYALHLGNFSIDEWVYEVNCGTTLADGVYEASIIIESVSPMSFILN